MSGNQLHHQLPMLALSSCFEVHVTDQLMQKPPHVDETPLREAFKRLAAELELLGETTARMETVVAGIAERAGVDHESSEELQQLDLIVQHADALRTFVVGLSEVASAKPLPIGGALDGVLLGDVRARLSGASSATASTREVEFF